MTKSVLVGFSGGADSCAAIGILRSQGYDVRAVTIDMTGDVATLDDARAKAAILGVELIVYDARTMFRTEVIDRFVESYMNGRTPSPCAICNPRIKWRILAELAEEWGADHIATGHYFGIAEHRGNLYITRPADRIKDQTYYLWGLEQPVLRKILTPMAGVEKADLLRSIPAEFRQRESMGVCFLGKGDYHGFIAGRLGGEIVPGEIVDKEGNVVGRHKGYPFYTIGQKKETGLPPGGCIVGIDPGRNRLVAGTDKDLWHSNLEVGSFNSADIGEVLGSDDITVAIRGLGRNPGGYGHVSSLGDRLLIRLDEPAWAAAKGQPVVMYRGDRLVGGGIVEKYY